MKKKCRLTLSLNYYCLPLERDQIDITISVSPTGNGNMGPDEGPR